MTWLVHNFTDILSYFVDAADANVMSNYAVESYDTDALARARIAELGLKDTYNNLPTQEQPNGE